MIKVFGILAVAVLLLSCNNEAEDKATYDSTVIKTDTSVVVPDDSITVSADTITY